MNKEIIIILKPLLFYSIEEDNLFLELIKKITCIKKIEKIENGFNIFLEVEISLKNKSIVFWKEYTDLNGIFKRYKLDNFYQIKKLKDKPPIIINTTQLDFYTDEDKEIFFEWLQHISSIEDIHWSGEWITLFFYNLNLPEEDLKNLAAIFDRYNLKRSLHNDYKYPRKKDNAIFFKTLKKYHKKPYQITYPFNTNYIPSNTTSLTLDPLKFYTKDDENFFLNGLKK